MKSRHLTSLATVILCVGLAGAAAPGSHEATSGPGVIVEDVDRGSALEEAGLRAGDLLLAWERLPDPPANPEGSDGEIQTVFDWMRVKAEQAPRGSVRLRGERDGRAISFEVPKGRPWAGRIRPRTAEDLRGWLLLQAGETWSKSRQGEKERSALQEALKEARDAQTQVVLWEALGKIYELENEMAGAEASFRSALEAGETAWGESLQGAGTIARLGDILRMQNRLDEAEQLQHRALEIRQRWSPDSLEVAESLTYLFIIAWARGDLEAMSEHIGSALAIQERWSPDGLPVANTLSNLSLLAIERGRYDEAAAALQRALAIWERLAPDSIDMATSLTNLGAVARFRGDFEAAEELHQRALVIWERLAPDSNRAAASVANLGAIARERGDLATAEKFFQRTLEIWRKAAPDGLGVAGSHDALGIVARLRGDLDEAWSLHHRALEIRERLAPGSLHVALSLSRLGIVAEQRGDLNQALDLHQRAQAIYERLKPGTIEEAQELQQLGRLYRRTRHPEQAARLLSRAVDALESQVGRLGGSQDLQATFRSRHDEIYRDAIEIALERGHTAEAFHLVERSRARSFLTLLAERDLEFSDDPPSALERSRRDNAARYDQTLRQLERWTPAAGEAARETLHGELSRLRRERNEIAAEIRKASPRLATLRQPQPLDLAAARNVLDAGTVALSYSVGKEQTALFAVTRDGGLRVEILPVGEERLRRDVTNFLERIQSQENPVDLARSLYRTLIGPVAGLVERSERVLILPDGPLHRLPFGALIRDTERGQFLAEWKPLHSALSLTVYGTLRASDGAPAGAGTAVIAFGDPRYSKEPSREVHDLILRSPGLRRFDWAALPYSRREVEHVAEVYPGARLYLGAEATEERARAVAREARILHFSTHGYLDDRAPLDSALVLTIPEELSAGRGNGLLQVWEIFESVRTGADLVVLSACESALGRELSGEGLIGLTRAFQYAGARSVVASLWSVTDQVTAELMARFYRHLAAGLDKDEALRVAQVELIRQPIRITTANGQPVETDASAPFFWAAFQLFGDWRTEPVRQEHRRRERKR